MVSRQKTTKKESRTQVVISVVTPMVEMPDDYYVLLEELKQQISQQRLHIVQSANVQMIMLYWSIGRQILLKQDQQGWGAKVIERLAIDLKKEFPEMSGFSPRNLKYMRKFAQSWSDVAIVQRTVAQIPWRSNIALLDKLDCIDERTWYASQALQQGWSRDILCLNIESKLHLRQGNSQNNFGLTLPPAQSDMAVQIFKDPYLFDFLGTDIPRREAELEQRLITHVEHFLLELGQGFAFVGRQVHLEVAGEDFYLDLLFYHLKLRCYVVIELKMGKFEPAYVSQLNMYQTLIDEQLRHSSDQQTIGLLLVKEKNQVIVEYALAGFNKPLGVAEWQQAITRHLPDDLKSSLPTIEQIERELEKE